MEEANAQAVKAMWPRKSKDVQGWDQESQSTDGTELGKSCK